MRLTRRLTGKIRSGAAAVLLAGAIPLAARLALLPWVPIPQPSIHDEFSYLLAADTFAHGRLTNPPHPLWRFFETFHVIQQPTYMSKFPPMQGLVLAFGQTVFGHPFWGVCLSAALMCAAICWVLQAWMPPGWALAGALLLAAKLVPPWANCYWGGSAATTGACLALGSFTRVMQSPPSSRRLPAYAVLMTIGFAVLLNSRPWEGGLFSLAIAVELLWWMVRSPREILRARLARIAAPCVLIMTLTTGAMAYYNWRITGSPRTLPYILHAKTYGVGPLFVWQRESPAPFYAHDVIRRMHREWEPNYQGANLQSTWAGWRKAKLSAYPILVFSTLLVCALLFQEPAVRLLAPILAVFLVGLCVQRYILLHYMGPILPAMAAVFMLLLRRVGRWRYAGRAVGQAAALIVLAGAFAYGLVGGIRTASWYCPERVAVESRLAEIPGRHLVLVRYGAAHWVAAEWVFNAADIDGSRIIWARDMGDEADRQLCTYYCDRKIWLLQPDRSPSELQPMTAECASPSR